MALWTDPQIPELGRACSAPTGTSRPRLGRFMMGIRRWRVE